MRTSYVAAVMALALGVTLGAALSDVAGAWIGRVDTERGQMDIALNGRDEKGKLVGVMKTGHGDWPISSAVEKDGTWTIGLQSPGGAATMTGRIADGKFTGKWVTPMATGTFEMVRPKRKPPQ